MKNSAMSVGLSQEELFVMLNYMGVTDLLGLDFNVLKELTEDQIKMALGVAERALVARGFLIPKVERLTLADVPHALVRTCTNPETSLLISCHYPERVEENYYFHLARKMQVLHTIPVTAIHQFIALESLNAMLQSALSTLQLGNPPVLKCESAHISDEVVTQAQEASQQGKDVLKILKASGLNQSVAREFATTLKEPTLNHSIAFLRHTSNGNSDVDGFALLGGKNGLWLMYPEDQAADEEQKMIFVQPVTPQEVAQKLKGYWQ